VTGTKRVIVRVAKVVGWVPANDREVSPRIEPAGEFKARYRDGGMIHAGDVRWGVAVALRIDPSAFRCTVVGDDGRALSGTANDVDTGQIIALWGTLGPHRDPPGLVNRVIVEGGKA